MYKIGIINELHDGLLLKLNEIMQDKLHWTVKAWHFKKNHSVIVSGYYFLSLESLPKILIQNILLKAV